MTEQKTLISNRYFRVLLLIGIALCVAVVVLRTLFFVYLLSNKCISGLLCWDNSSKYHTCNIDDRVYCCGNSIGDYSCGQYPLQCEYRGDGYKDCYSVFINHWIVLCSSFAVFVVLVVFACFHKYRKIDEEKKRSILMEELPNEN